MAALTMLVTGWDYYLPERLTDQTISPWLNSTDQIFLSTSNPNGLGLEEEESFVVLGLD